MRNLTLIGICAVLVTACPSRDVGPNAPTAQDKTNETVAAQKSMCTIENQTRCDHLIENRNLFGRFFAPQTLGGMDENEKQRGRRITTKFVVEAVAAINQCKRVELTSIPIVKGMIIAKQKFNVMGTSPLVKGESTCFITPQTEG